MRSRSQRSASLFGALFAALAAALALPCAAQDGGVAAPLPPAGKAAATVLALLTYNREQCDGIAGKLVAHWQGLSTSPAAQLETMRQRVVDVELSTLASARAASDLVGRLLSRVRQEEARSDAGDSLGRLHALIIELCDTVAFPSGPREAFESEVATVLDRIEREEAELGRLLVVPEAELKSALEPYLGYVQLAGVEAEGEYRDHLDSLKPPPKQPTFQELMEAWHRGYAQAVIPTKQALGRYLRGRHDNDSSMIRTSCREILAAVIPLLRNERAFEAPLPAVVKPLRRAFKELQSMASECTAGRSREMEDHYREMQIQLADAAGQLAEFSLKP
jgi:hypothetical protein